MIDNNDINPKDAQISQSIEKILSDKNTILEDLFEYDQLLDEFNNKNENLFKFFNKEKIKSLITYIIKEPQIDDNEIESKESKNKIYKYPFLCSEIFKLEKNELLKYFFMTNKQIEKQLKQENKKMNEEIGKNEEKYNEIVNKKKEMTPLIESDKIKINKDDFKIINDVLDNTNKFLIPKKENYNYIENSKKKINEQINDKTPKNSSNTHEKQYTNEEMNINYEDRMELIDYLFTFFPQKYDDDKKLNYVLCGYFYQLISNLLDYNPKIFLQYLYNKRKDVFFLMVSHCYRKSISDALSKLLQFENYFNQNIIDLDEEMKNNMNETRIEILRDIFSAININMDIEKLNSIYFFIIGFFEQNSILKEKDIFQKMINDDEIIKSLIYKPLFNLDLINNKEDALLEIKKNNFIIIIDILIFLLKNIKYLELDVPSCSSKGSFFGIKHTKISKEIFEILANLIEVNFNKINNTKNLFLQSFNEYQLEPLGEYKIKIVDLISNLIPYFKNISNYFDEILINTNFFQNGFKFIFVYEWNNLYQESFLTLLKSFLDNSITHELLFNYLFNKLKIFELIKIHLNNEDKFKFMNQEISKDISHGYISFLISLSYKINTIIGGEPISFNTHPSTEGNFEFLLQTERNNENIEDIMVNKNNENVKEDKNTKKELSIEKMKKYLNDDWKLFFRENISGIIKQYSDKNWPKKEINLDIFDFLFQENNDNENKEKEEENNKENIINLSEINHELKDEINNDNIKRKDEINFEIMNTIIEFNKENIKRKKNDNDNFLLINKSDNKEKLGERNIEEIINKNIQSSKIEKNK